MTKQEWTAELETVLAADGGQWRLFKAWVKLGSPMCGAELTDYRQGPSVESFSRRIAFPRHTNAGGK
jgi:hypothetical protein